MVLPSDFQTHPYGGCDGASFGQTNYLVDIDLFMLRASTDLQMSALDCPVWAEIKKIIKVLKMFFIHIHCQPQ